MRHRKKLLATGVAGIAVVALAPYARDAWEERRLEQARLEFIQAKDREIACLERLQQGGLKEGANVQREIARCREQAAQQPDD